MKFISQIRSWLMPGDVPLAWRQLSGDKKRFTAALAGVSFGVVIMLFQVGIYQAFMRMVIRPIVAMQGELIMVSPDFLYMMSAGEFPERRLYQTLADSDVKSVYPVALCYHKWSNPSTRTKTEIALVGVHASKNPFLIPEVASRSDILASPEDVLFDVKSTPDCGDIGGLFHKHGEVRTEINGRRIRVGGLFSMGQTLAAYGHVIMGMETYQRLSGFPSGIINIGLIRLEPGANWEAVKSRLEKIIPEDVKVITRDELILYEQTYWQNNTPIGFIVMAGMVLAMFVGAVIVYQILYTDVNDHIKEYATLKAIGLGQGFFFNFIISQSLILLIIGFIPGILITSLLFAIADSSAGLPTRLTLSGAFTVFFLSAIMCLTAGLLATRRLRSVDPADIF